jgi:hypothetical protein
MKRKYLFLLALPIVVLPLVIKPGTGTAPLPQAVSGPPVSILNDPNLPLQIERVKFALSDDGNTLSGPEIVIRNTGSERCLAFALELKKKLADGRIARSYYSEDYAQAGIGSDTGIAPNQVHTRVSPGYSKRAPGHPAVIGVEASVDYVEMSDGRTFGPDAAGRKLRFGAMRAAHRHERKRLDLLQREKGTEELLKELRKP